MNRSSSMCLKKLDNGSWVWKYGINAFIYLYVRTFVRLCRRNFFKISEKIKSLSYLNNQCNSILPLQKRLVCLLWDTATQIMLIFAQMLIEKMYQRAIKSVKTKKIKMRLDLLCITPICVRLCENRARSCIRAST